MNKSLIAKRFAKAAKSYDREAVVQRAIVRHEVNLLRSVWNPTAAPQILEIGCGTGFLTRELLEYAPLRYVANDLVAYPQVTENMAVEFLQGDAEQVDFPQEMDLIASCSAIQWMTDMTSFAGKCAASLKPDGWIAFSSFGPENFREIRELTGEGLLYYSLNRLTQILEKHFTVMTKGEEVHQLHFPSPIDVLRHLRATGVTGTRPYSWNKQRLQEFYEQYTQRYANAQGRVILTYHPLYVLAKKK